MFDHRTDGRWWDIGRQLVEGCTKVSPGCDNCWSLAAANMRRFNPNPKVAARYEGTVTQWTHRQEGEGPAWTGRVNPQWQDLYKIGSARKPQVYTVWNDLFHPGVPFDLTDDKEKFIDNVIIKIITRPQHFYIICTKRPERALEYFLSRQANLAAWPEARDILSRRLMIMTSVENQEMADLRVPILLQIPAGMHGVSLEPLLGPVDFSKVVCNDGDHLGPFLFNLGEGAGIDWVITGGETGPHARPMHPDWVCQVRDQCQAAEVPFFLKSLGEWVPALSLSGEEGINFWKIEGKRNNSWGTLDLEGNWFPMTTPWNSRQGDDSPEREYVMYRVGKKTAGRLLDGHTWDEVPHVDGD
jgi:protein gp37